MRILVVATMLIWNVKFRKGLEQQSQPDYHAKRRGRPALEPEQRKVKENEYFRQSYHGKVKPKKKPRTLKQEIKLNH